MRNSWTEKEDNIIRKYISKLHYKQLAELLPGRTADAIRTRCKILELDHTALKKQAQFKELTETMIQKGYELIDVEKDYKNLATPIRYICPRHRNKGVLTISLGHLREGKGCKYCGFERTTMFKTKPVYENELRTICTAKGFEYVGYYRKDKLYIQFICNRHKDLGVQSMGYFNMCREYVRGCQYCIGRNLPEWYVMKMMNEKNPDIELLEPYTNLTTRMKCRCKKHNEITSKTMKEILKGQGCARCGYEKVAEAQRLTSEEFNQRIHMISSKIKPIGEYKGYDSPIKVQCCNCNHIWEQKAYMLLQTGVCPNCDNHYKGEQDIQNILNKWGFKYKCQYTFDDCRNKRCLPFDFGVLDLNNNLLCLIEYDGEGHFSPINYSGNQIHAINIYEGTVKRDNIKNEYCTNKKIPLIRIPYWEKDNIEQLLFDEFLSLNLITKI